MSDPTPRLRLRRQGLPLALACTLAVGVSGCSTWRMHDLAWFGSSRSSCSSDAWPTRVKGSIQRAEASWKTTKYAAEEPSEPAAEAWSERVEVSPEPVPPAAKDIVEPAPATPPGAPPEDIAEPAPPAVPEAAPQAAPEAPPKDLVEPAPPAVPQTAPEAAPKELAEPAPTTVPESAPTPVPEAGPKDSSPPAAEQVAPSQPPAAELPAAKPDKDVVARMPEATVPVRPQPSPEVVRMCGAGDTACQDELTALLADPAHKWMSTQPTPREERTGVRILAYRVLAPSLACEDLRRGLLETLAETGEDQSATRPEATESGKSQAWVQLLRRAVELELRAEIDKRC